ncbi:SCL-interrupting locus protein homolog isoform X2 [Octopus bimaculoides]|nr:SCL-interrupting locus protein homolog isoform X2 [Octopus bimaculoides]|eukprot:XP_014791141.1 PREDICTED: SCL-interrupting locus protein homolog isoform X2 [Octopus bimaculoides]
MKDLKFPSVRTVLWDRASQGPAVNVDISSFRKFQICLSSKALYILLQHCSGLVENQLLLLSGYIHSDNDGSKFSILVDPLDVSNLTSERNEKSLQISVLVSKSNKCGFIPEDYNRAVKNVLTRCGSKDSIGIGSFFSVLGKFFVQTENGSSAYCVEFDVFTSAAKFEAVPINPVTIMTTALAKNLASPMSLSRLQGKAKSGYVTMDHTRKLVLMLESDPKVSTLPLIGIWVSGVDCVKNPYVWASCLRYLYNNSLNQRVCLPPHRFMLLLYCLQGNKIEFYECGLLNEKEKTHEMDAFCGSKTVRLDFDQDGLEVDLSLLKYGIKKNRIDSVAARVNDKSKSKPSSSCVNDEIIPRTIPTPHQSKIPEARFSVPEVSLIFNDTSQASLQRKCHDNSSHPVPNKITPPSPSPSNYSSPVCTQGLPSLPMRNSYPSSKAGNAIYSASLAPTQFCQQPSKPLMYSGVPINQNITTDGNMYTNHPTLQPLPNRNPLPVSEYNRSVYPSPIPFPNKEIMQGSNSEQHPHFQYYPQNNLIPLPNSYTHHPKPVMDSMPNTSPYGPFPSQPNFMKPSPCFTSPVMCERYHMVNSHPMPPHSSMSTYPRTAIDKLPALPSCPCCVVQPNPSYHHTSTPTIPPANQAPVVNVCQGHEKNINCIATHIQCHDKHDQEITVEKLQQTKLNAINSSNSSYSNTPPNNSCNSVKENTGARQHENSVIEVSEDQNFRASKDSGLSESPDSSQETDPQLSKIQRESIPPEIYRLLMQQSAELQELKAQIQQMKIDQNSAMAFNQSLNPCSTCSSVVSAKSESSESKASSEKSVERYSVGVNTSFQTSASPETTPNNLINLQSSPKSPLKTKADNFPPVSAPTASKMGPTSSVSSQTWPPHHETDGSYTLATTEFSHGEDFSAVAQCLSVNQKSVESFHSDLVLDLPSYQTSLSRSSDHQAIEGVQTSESTNGLVSVSMCAKRTSNGGDEDFEEDHAEEIPGTIKNKEYYDGLINYVKELLQQESPTESEKHEKRHREKESGSPDSVLTSTNQDKESLISNNTSYLCSGFNSVDCTLLPKINYISMLLESDTETSMEINSMALKYLKDEQLTQMAKLRSQSTTPTAAKANNKNFLCQIMRYGLDSSSPDISKYGMSVNDLTFATRKYMEKHHLIEESDSKNMSFLLKDDTANYLPFSHTRNSNSSQISNSSENMALFERPKEVRQNLTQTKLNVRKPFQNIQQKLLPMSESTPMFKPYPKKQSPEQPQMFLQTPPPVLEGDPGNSSANERILDIAKLKQMPKLL